MPAARPKTGNSPARALALEVLARVAKTDAFVKPVLDAVAAERGISPVERALASELVYGVLRHRRRLDHAISPCVQRGIDSVAAVLLDVLRLGAYQLFRMRIPAHAAVSETVALARSRGGEPAARFVNAILRALTRSGEPALPDASLDLAAHLEVRESFPRWMVDRAIADLGADQAAHLLEASNVPGPLTVRVNTLRTTREDLVATLAREGVLATPTKHAPFGLHLEGAGDVAQLAAFQAGLMTVQDEASQLVVELADVAPDARILDVCAAPGGKATALAERASRGTVDAFDRHPRRTERIREAAARLGLTNLTARVGDGTALPRALQSSYGVVLVDAPCTGLGVLRRHPEAKWRVTDRDVAELAAVQARLLGAAARYVREGGALVYAVCTTSREETSDVARCFEDTHSTFERVAPAPGSMLASLCDKDGALRLWPHLHGTDGFFAVRFRRMMEAPS